MTVKGNAMQKIREYLSILTVYVKLSASSGCTDINRDAEDFYCGLLNTAFGWKLKNLNAMQMDYPAIDLADEENGICIQVTSTEGRDKVAKTIQKFFKHELNARFSRLIILVIGEKPRYRATIWGPPGFDFEQDRDVWDTPYLIREIEALPDETIMRVRKYLEQHLGISRSDMESGNRKEYAYTVMEKLFEAVGKLHEHMIRFQSGAVENREQALKEFYMLAGDLQVMFIDYEAYLRAYEEEHDNFFMVSELKSILDSVMQMGYAMVAAKHDETQISIFASLYSRVMTMCQNIRKAYIRSMADR